MDFRFFHVDAAALGAIILGIHVFMFTGTLTYFQKDLPEDTRSQPITKITLFILGNIWPLTWMAWSVYAICYKISCVKRNQRIQKLVDKNTKLLDEIHAIEKELKHQQEVNRKLEEEIHQNSHKLSLQTVGQTIAQLEDQDRKRRESELAKKRHPNSSKKPHPREELPPYSPDVWKAIRKLEMMLENAIPSELLKRIHMIENYLAKWDGTGDWNEYLKSLNEDEEATDEK